MEKKKCIKVYISGKITGLDRKEAMLNFFEAEQKVKGYFEQFFEQVAVFNPMKKPGPDEGVNYEDCMEIDFMYINKCTAIYMIKGWENSKGAKMELDYSRFMGKDIYYEWCSGTINADLSNKCQLT